MTCLLDTHTWIWWHTRPEHLSKRARSLLDKAAAEQALLLSAISPWEFAKLVEKGRLKLSVDGGVWLERAFAALPLQVVPLTPEVAWSSTCLPAPFHDDPADQIIVATARQHDATILTRDELIRGYPHARSVW